MHNITKWFGIRPYAGLVITSPDDNKNKQFPEDFQVTTKAFFFFFLDRVAAPILWVAPCFEVGIVA